MVPYTSFMTLEKTKGANEITRYNMYNSAAIRGFPAKGYTTGDAIQSIRDVAKNTPSPVSSTLPGKTCPTTKRNEAMSLSLFL